MPVGLGITAGTEVDSCGLLRRIRPLDGGWACVVVGDAGVGKSRLFWEFTHSPRTQGWLIVERSSVSYGKATSYLPVFDLLKGYFQTRRAPRGHERLDVACREAGSGRDQVAWGMSNFTHLEPLTAMGLLEVSQPSLAVPLVSATTLGTLLA
jgi:hypothetical protein